jgi:YD repeat-containing protein
MTLVDCTYDARNRLTAADNVTYSYDAENNRTAMTVTPSSGTAVTTNYTIDPHGDALPRVVKRTKSGATTYYVYGIGLLYQVTVSGETETPLYYHFDNLGSTTAITNASQTVTDRAEYGIYGHTLFRTGSTDTPLLRGTRGARGDRK